MKPSEESFLRQQKELAEGIVKHLNEKLSKLEESKKELDKKVVAETEKIDAINKKLGIKKPEVENE